MRLKEREITDKSQMEAILNNARVCRLAMVDQGEAYIVPLNFGYQDGVLYFHSATEGRKIEILKKNPNICFEVDELIRLKKASKPCDWGAEYKSVIGTGKACFIESMEEKRKALDIIMAHYSSRQFQYPEENMERTAVIRVDIAQMTGKQAPGPEVQSA